MVLPRSLAYVRPKREKRRSIGDRSEGTTPRCRIAGAAIDPVMEHKNLRLEGHRVYRAVGRVEG
jgi:hypothetical protein